MYGIIRRKILESRIRKESDIKHLILYTSTVLWWQGKIAHVLIFNFLEHRSVKLGSLCTMFLFISCIEKLQFFLFFRLNHNKEKKLLAYSMKLPNFDNTWLHAFYFLRGCRRTSRKFALSMTLLICSQRKSCWNGEVCLPQKIVLNEKFVSCSSNVIVQSALINCGYKNKMTMNVSKAPPMINS